MPDPASAAATFSFAGESYSLFWLGLGGAVAVEFAAYASYFDSASHPEKYRKVGYYIAKIGLAVAGGFLVLVYNTTSPLAAIQIGASTSVFLLALSKKEPPITTN